MSTFVKNGNSSFNEASDFKRRIQEEEFGDEHAEEMEAAVTTESDGYTPAPLTGKAVDYVRDCESEKLAMEKKFPIAERLIDNELEKVYTSGRIPTKEYFANIYREKPMRVAQKVLVPVREHPRFNFIGKILGPKGNTLRRLQEETMCKMVILGRNSMKDKTKEEELRASGDPRFAHLHRDLHIEISTIAPPSEAFARLAYALAELRKYFIPDANDEIRQEQLRELQSSYGPPREPGRKIPPYLLKAQSYNPRPAPPSPGYSSSKPKVLSILDKARAAMDESHRHGYEAYEHPGHYGYEQVPPEAYEMVEEPPPPQYRREYVLAKPGVPVRTSYRPAPSHYPPVPGRRPEEIARPRETVRYRTAPYLKPK